MFYGPIPVESRLNYGINGPEAEPTRFYGGPHADSYISLGADTVVLGGGDDFALVESTVRLTLGKASREGMSPYGRAVTNA